MATNVTPVAGVTSFPIVVKTTNAISSVVTATFPSAAAVSCADADAPFIRACVVRKDDTTFAAMGT